MKIQNLAVIFIIIVLPISIILTSYVQSQVKTLSLQTEYDAKLNNATYDAVKAFQINTINSDSSDLANSKLRDIEASVNSFFTSIANNFNMAGYNQDILKEYVPALVYTMYDGYYIYSPYINTLDNKNKNEDEKTDAEILSQGNSNATYKEGERLSGLKPYIYYSCRYKRNDDDFVITYSLDNYITIQGIINNKSVFDYGYLLDNITESTSYIQGEKIYTYRGVSIGSGTYDRKEVLKEYLEDGNEYNYTKINGVKYYYDNNSQSWFSILNGERFYTNEKFNVKSRAAELYYREAMEFTKRAKEIYNLGELTVSNARDENGEKIYEKDENGENTTQLKFGSENQKIFDFQSTDTSKSIEDSDSDFNQHRLAVIRYSIEKNLSIAIANYNNYSINNPTDFRMPKLKEDEWEKIINNVSMISFLQGLNIGGKVYNGYSIITNNKNKEVVNEDSIYILTNDGEYHRPKDSHLKDKRIEKGILNIDFETKSSVGEDGVTKYFIPQPHTGCYSSIVTQTGVETIDDIYKYMTKFIQDNRSTELAQKYYTALGRERYSMYKTNNNLEDIKKNFLVNN